MTDRRSAQEGGFVLLDLLVAMILLSMTLVLFTTSLHFGLRVADSSRVRDRVAGLALAADALSGWFAGALPVRRTTAEGPSRVMFEGAPDRLLFVTLSNGDVQPGGMLRIAIGFDGKGAVAFEARPLAVGSTDIGSWNPPTQVLLENATSLRFSYYGAPTVNAAPKWFDEWKDTVRLPRLVALRIELNLRQATEPFDLTFRILSE